MIEKISIKKVQMALIIINFFAILYHDLIFYYGTKLAENKGMSIALLEHLNAIPFSPTKMLVMSIILYFLLVFLMYYRNKKGNNYSIIDILSIIELLLMLSILYSLKYSYNGVVLLVLLDIFYESKESKLQNSKKNYFIFIVLSLLTLLLTNYDLIQAFVSTVSIDPYIHMYPSDVQNMLVFIRQFLVSINLITFMICLLLYILNAVKEKNQIEAKLEVASKANKELKNYLALSEKVAEDRERKRIARDIHDTLGHALTGISAGIDAVKILVDNDPSLAKQQLEKISGAVREGLSDVRGSLKKMRPSALIDASFEEALKNVCKEYESLSNIKIHFNYNWGMVDFEVVKEDSLFRIIQESITNTVRHGHANNIWIDFFETQDEYELFICDDGKPNPNFKMGYGLKQMKERVYALGGEIKFSTDSGFSIEITLPN